MANQILAGAVINAGMIIAGVDADNPPVTGSSPGSGLHILPLSSAVSLLMDASATADGSVVDGSTNSHAITVNGDVSQSSYSPYRSGGYSREFSTGYIAKTADDDSLNFGSDDFTVEMWFNAGPQTANYPGLFSGSNYNVEGSASFRFDNINYDQKVWLYINGVGDPAIVTTNTYAYYQWHHTALVRNGTNLSIYVNGVQDASITISASQNINFDHGEFRIGRGFDVDGGHGYFNGKIADVRAVRGTAVYTSDFTVPTERPTEVAGTSLLTCNLPYLQSGLTMHGGVSADASGPYDYAGYSEAKHGGSYAFDGSSRLTLSSQLPVSGEFALESWVHLDDNYSDPYVCGTLDGSNIQILRIKGGYPYFSHRAYQSYSNLTAGAIDDGGLKGNTLLRPGQWYHLALTRDSNDTLRIFVNGQLDAAATWSYDFNFNTIGALTSGNGHMQGSISDFRVVLNAPVYTADFTPPTAPLEAVTGTSLLLSGNNATIRDESQSVESISVFGNTTVADSSPYSTGKSMTFDGDGDMVSATVDNGVGAVEFTVEFWMYRESDTGMIFNNRTNGANDDGFDIRSDLDITTSHNRFFSGRSLENNRWYHVAITRDSSYLTTLFIDGVNVGTSTVSNAFTGSSVYIGGNPHENVGYFNGKIADFRIVTGEAVYTENFSVPTAPLGDYSESISTSPPTISGVASAYTLTQGQDTVITGVATDPDGDAITWSYDIAGEISASDFTLTGMYNNNLAISANGLGLTIDPAGNGWKTYQNLPTYLTGLLCTTGINEGESLSFTIPACTVYMLRVPNWDGVDTTGWTEVESGQSYLTDYSGITVYSKEFSAGTYNFDNQSAMYMFASETIDMTVSQTDNVFTITPGTTDISTQITFTATDSAGNATSVSSDITFAAPAAATEYLMMGAMWSGGMTAGEVRTFDTSGSLIQTYSRPSNIEYPYANYGKAVATNGVKMAVGAPSEEVNGVHGQGEAIIMDIDGSNPISVLYQDNRDTSSGDEVGDPLAMSDSSVYVGIWKAEPAGGSGSGAVAIYDHNGNLQSTKYAYNYNSWNGSNQFFGYQVGWTGTYMVASAPQSHSESSSFWDGYFVVYDENHNIKEQVILANSKGDRFGDKMNVTGPECTSNKVVLRCLRNSNIYVYDLDAANIKGSEVIISLPSTPWSVAINDTYVYATDGAADTVKVFDHSGNHQFDIVPTQDVLDTLGETLSSIGFGGNLETTNDHLAVVTGTNGKVVIYNIDGTNPVAFDTGGGSYTGFWSGGMQFYTPQS